ncbi:MAG: DUF4827 domain-containing protein [Prevotella sp.]|nr:DUF4827 domain-containing protein [Prevotella sp.]
MKRLIYPLITLLATLVCYTSCENYETYRDKKEKERSAIDRFITKENIKVIDEATFNAQGETTDTTQNEFVRLTRSGVYMQIVREGCGSMLEEQKTVNLLCRFTEYNILADSVLASNSMPFYFYNSALSRYVNGANFVDKMSVKRSGTTITASFVEGVMLLIHNTSSSVPGGWLVPLNYVNVGRPLKADDEIAKVRLIVPHSQGTAEATSSVYPCFYEITYEREK